MEITRERKRERWREMEREVEGEVLRESSDSCWRVCSSSRL